MRTLRLLHDLKRLRLYDRVRFSPVYVVYLHLVRRDLLAIRDREINFFRATLDELVDGDLIFDIGANEGYKSGVFLKLGARVVSVEPDPMNARRLRHRYLTRRIVVVEKAVSDHSGTAVLRITQPGSALNTISAKWSSTLGDPSTSRFDTTFEFPDSIEVPTVTLDDLIDEYGRPVFVKVDVEGNELNVLRGLTQPVAYLSFEVNLPEFLDESLGCIDLLEKLDGDVELNYDTESGHLDAWRSAEDFRQWMRSTTLRYMEVYARSSPRSEK